MEQLEIILETLLDHVVNLGILVFEFIGVAVILSSGIMGIIKWIRHSGDTKIYLARGLALGLEFKMGSEILRTVVSPPVERDCHCGRNYRPPGSAVVSDPLGDQRREKGSGGEPGERVTAGKVKYA